MDSLVTAITQFVYDSGFSILNLLKSLDLGVILGIIVLTSVLKAALARWKDSWLTDQTILLFIAVLGLASGIFFSPTADAPDILRSAMNYAGGAVLCFMLWKHLLVKLIEKVFGTESVVTRTLQGSFRSTNTNPSNQKVDDATGGVQP